jgi:cytidylate kinase
MEKNIILALDGPAGSGKTTTAKLVADRLGYLYIDTGAMYRAVTYAWLKENKELNEKDLCNLVKGLKIELRQSDQGQKTILNGEDVTDAVRFPEVTKNVSAVSAIGCVREALVKQQREIGKNGGVVMDGRDIGTVVFPNADLKIFFKASIEERAKRRAKEMIEKGLKVSIEQIKKEISDRDNYDSTRDISPLKMADDAVEIDNSNLTIDEQTTIVEMLARKRISQ